MGSATSIATPASRGLGQFRIFGTALIVTSQFLLAACSGGSGGGPSTEERIVPETPLNFESCDPKNVAELEKIIKDGRGDVSEKAGNASKTEWVNSAFFEKPYDRYDLEAVLDTATISTALYVKSLGVSLYKAPRESLKGLCPMYFYLKAPPKSIQKIWDGAADGGRTGSGTLAGLFFEYCGDEGLPSCSEREMVSPTILVDEAADRWTLVHEMMHYNFNQGRKGSLEIPAESYLKRGLKKTEEAIQASYSAYKNMPNRTDLSDALSGVKTVIELTKMIHVRHTLEELTIEGMLIDLWSKGDLRNVSGASAESGLWYMKFSRDGFFQDLPPLEQMIANLKKEADANFWPEIAGDCDQLQALIQSYRTESEEKIKTARAQITSIRGKFFEESPRLTPQSLAIGFNVVTHEKAARAHMAGHDEAELAKDLQETITELAKTIH